MKEPTYTLQEGTEIVTHATLESTRGLFVHPDYLAARRTDAAGTIRGCVGGHGGDVYWVEHADTSMAVYVWTEFELADSGAPG